MDSLFLGDGWCVALHVKTAAQRGGVIEDIAFERNVARNVTALLRLATFGKSVRPTGYAATTVRDLAWRHNAYVAARGAARRRVRSKFLCPTRGQCHGLRVLNNSIDASSSFQCVGVRLNEEERDEGQRGVRGGSCDAAAEKKATRRRRGRR